MPLSAEVVTNLNPHDPADVVIAVPQTRRPAADAAVLAGRRAQADWWEAGAAQRASALAAGADALMRQRDAAVALIVREVGKPVAEARGEVDRAVAILRFYAQAAFFPTGELLPPSVDGKLWTERRPLGVAGLITPWNFPLAIPLWKAAPALVMGNAVVLKPSPEGTAVALWLQELLTRALPRSLFQVLPGGADVGTAVVGSADVVSFTGSETVGRQVTAAATRRGVPVQAEMGGQNAAIVLPDADTERLARLLAGAAMGYAGQKCTATRRVVVVGDRQRYQEVAGAVTAAVEALEVGDPAVEGVTVGPVITDASRDRLLDGARQVRTDGGRLLTSNSTPAAGGFYVPPVLTEGLAADHRLAQEELFGPLALMIPARDLSAALSIANDVRFGLVTNVHGRDSGALLEAASALRAGMVKINAPTTGVDFYAPFGGEGASGYGPREQGTAALNFYSSTRTVTFASHP